MNRSFIENINSLKKRHNDLLLKKNDLTMQIYLKEQDFKMLVSEVLPAEKKLFVLYDKINKAEAYLEWINNVYQDTLMRSTSLSDNQMSNFGSPESINNKLEFEIQVLIQKINNSTSDIELLNRRLFVLGNQIDKMTKILKFSYDYEVTNRIRLLIVNDKLSDAHFQLVNIQRSTKQITNALEQLSSASGVRLSDETLEKLRNVKEQKYTPIMKYKPNLKKNLLKYSNPLLSDIKKYVDSNDENSRWETILAFLKNKYRNSTLGIDDTDTKEEFDRKYPGGEDDDGVRYPNWRHNIWVLYTCYVFYKFAKGLIKNTVLEDTFFRILENNTNTVEPHIYGSVLSMFQARSFGDETSDKLSMNKIFTYFSSWIYEFNEYHADLYNENF